MTRKTIEPCAQKVREKVRGMKYNAVLFDYAGTLNGSGETHWVTQMLHDLFEAGYRIGIVSNSNRYGDARWLRDRVAHNKWNAYLECTCGSGGMFSRQARVRFMAT